LAIIPKIFVVPSLAEADNDYADRARRFAELHDGLHALLAERRALEKAAAAAPAPRMKSAVAALLGDTAVDEHQERVRRLAEVRRAIVDHETAINLQRGRLADARGPASAKVRAAVKAEYGQRVAAIVEALKAVDEARRSYSELVKNLEVEDVEWTALGPLGLGFLGEVESGMSFHVGRVAREAREAGYVS